MPNWKKVLTSGSVGELSSLFAPSITGSLLGTASYAVTASLPLQGIVTASSDMNHITFTKGDGSTFNILLSTGSVSSASYSATASYVNPLRQDVNITGSLLLTASHIAQVDYIDFETGSVVPAWKSGRVFWNDIDGALSVYNAEQDITLQVGQENWTRVRNNTGTTVTNGTVVKVIGSQGDAPTVERAQSIAKSGSINVDTQILGVATHDIEDNSFGYVTTQGLVRGLTTNAFNDGDTLFVGTGSAGVLQNTAPRAPYEIIPVGVCVKAGTGGSGIIYVAVQQPLDFLDLSSVEQSGSYSYGDLWTYVPSGSFGVWRHTNQLSGSYGITGSLIVKGTGSFDYLFVNTIVSSSVVYSSGSNQLGDATDDIQRLIGSILISGSTYITGSTSLNGSLTTKTFRLTGSAYTASATDYRIGVRYTDTGSVSIQLPLISKVGQIEYKIKDEEGNATVNNITLVASSSNLIDRSSTAVLRRDYIAVGLYNDGVSNWYIE